MTAETFTASVPLWTCGQCRSTWHDPWLIEEAAAWLYNEVQPLHRYGWFSLQNWLERKSPSFLAKRTNIRNLLRDRAPGPMRYAELNCPFSGLAFAEAERLGAAGRKFVETWFGLLANGHTEPQAFLSETDAFLTDRTLLVADSPLCWGRNCRKDGVSCRDLSVGPLFQRMVDLDEADRMGERFDLIGAFILDHMPDPNAALFKLLRLGRRPECREFGPGGRPEPVRAPEQGRFRRPGRVDPPAGGGGAEHLLHVGDRRR